MSPAYSRSSSGRGTTHRDPRYGREKGSNAMRNLFRISLCMTALALLCLTIPARAGDSVPFKATAGTVTTDIQFAPCGAIFTNVGAGEATHLGLFTLIDQSCSHPPGYVNNEGGDRKSTR